MRAMLSVVLALASAAILTGAGVAPPPAKTIYLSGAAALDELRDTNPLHYARAVKIIAAAPQLCRFDTPGTVFAAFEARDVRCLRGFLKTSFPAKWQLDFQLDEVHYVALVTVTGVTPRLLPAR